MNKKSFVLKTLQESFEKQERIKIQQQNENIFCVNQNQEKQNITQFKDELIKQLKHFIMNQSDVKLNMIEKYFKMVHKQKYNGTKFEGLIFQKQQEYLEEYITLLLSLQNKQEDLIIQIRNPFNNKNLNWSEMYAEKMCIYEKYTDSCRKCQENRLGPFSYLTIGQCIEQIKQYELSKIKIDQIHIIEELGICGHGFYEETLEYTTQINLQGIQCDNVEIHYYSENGDLFNNTIKLSLQYPLKLLKIKLDENYGFDLKYNLYLDINFLNESSNISKLEIHLPPESDDNYFDYNDEDDDDYEEYEENSKFYEIFNNNKISEYELYFKKCIDAYDLSQKKSHFQLFKKLLKLDFECEKLILFSNYNREQEYFENFIQLRNKIYTIKLQLVVFYKINSEYLVFNPAQAFQDIREDFPLN